MHYVVSEFSMSRWRESIRGLTIIDMISEKKQPNELPADLEAAKRELAFYARNGKPNDTVRKRRPWNDGY